MKNKIFEKADNIVLRQHNDITEARYDMSSFEKNIFYMLLSKLKDNDPEGKIYEIYAKEIELLTNNQLHYTYLRKSVKKMLGCVYSLRVNDEVVQFPLLTSSEYKKRTGVIELEISNKIRPFFFALKNNYTLFQFQTAMKLKSKHSKRIYEMLHQFKSTGIFRISVKELKERFELINSETGKEQYKNFNDFDRNVLQVAQREINKTTEISFNYTTKETSQKITGLEFIIRSKEVRKEVQRELTKSSDVDLEVEKLKDRLVTKFKLSKTLAKKIIENIPLQEIHKILYDIQVEDGANKIRKIGAYATTIFQNRLDGVSEIDQKLNSPRHIPSKGMHQIPMEKSLTQAEKIEEAQAIEYQNPVNTSRLGSTAAIGELLPQIMASSRPVQMNSSVMNSSVSKEENSSVSKEEKEAKSLKDKEKYLVWRKLYNDFKIDYLKVDTLMAKYSLEDIKAAISKVYIELSDQEIPQKPSYMIQMLKKHLNLV